MSRAYVISDTGEVVSLKSSKKLAIKACEEILKDDPCAEWRVKDKHAGFYDAGDTNASYEMFYVNE